ncbi:MAG: ribbon-helix-helix protein, CopG family [Proteobacteria bacterium]|nr:MAG: ribbon-helix-helix protein, CopG family [Pseudomonadota bacterium]
MKSNTKSSITLPAEELKLVNKLAKRLNAKSKVEVIRRGLRMLDESLERARLRASFAQASMQVREAGSAYEGDELPELAGEGLED